MGCIVCYHPIMLEPSGSLDSSTEDLITTYEEIQKSRKIILPKLKYIDKR